ncbi:RidA family protein [Aurantiacibacter suaedae]|uniref:RidA family protein n=1 Tax=Aurantiacibacter suaedae TaxID=2545755 RepID=UPI0010F808E2|nr:RidA family protein [Aurantiacibacter suaedae]
MTKITKVKTGSPTEQHGSYSRLVAVDDWIFVSNTAGRNPETKQIPEDLAEQTNQVLDNISKALEAVGASLADVVSAKVFIQDPDDLQEVVTAYGARMRGIDPTLTLTCPPLGLPEYKVEIEVTAYRGASEAEIVEIDLSAK